MNLVTVQCMGAFREIGESFTVDAEEMIVQSVRKAVENHLTASSQFELVEVLNRSTFACDDKLLRDHDALESQIVILLPPVAGG